MYVFKNYHYLSIILSTLTNSIFVRSYIGLEYNQFENNLVYHLFIPIEVNKPQLIIENDISLSN